MEWLLPTGVDDFRELIETTTTTGSKYLFVDKTLFIRDILDRDGSRVIVITRPRRFGKTLNLSMLQHFLSEIVAGKPTHDLFNGLKIQHEKACLENYQGKFPVIFLTLKSVQENTFAGMLKSMAEQIKRVFKAHQYLLESNKLSASDKKLFQSLIDKTAPLHELKNAIYNLADFLNSEFGESPYLLIDEYDTPIQAAYLKGHYEETIEFFKGFFGESLKGQIKTTKAILTGVTRVSKESLFSDVNNLAVYSVLNEQYSEYFGFTQDETTDLIKRAQLSCDMNQMKEWYNGYVFGKTTIYNPWSIINFIKNKGELDPYWVNTSSNELIKDLIIQSDSTVKNKLQELLAGKIVESYVDEHIIFTELKSNNADTIWSLLLMTGYLKQLGYRRDNYSKVFALQIPNKEISFVYKKIIRHWLSGTKNLEWYTELLQDLTTGKFAEFEDKLKRVMWNIVSARDVPNDTKELFYHGLVLGLVTGLIDTYEIKSEKESGAGIYDICLLPRDINQHGIVIELKALDTSEENQLTAAAKAAMEQIEQRRYVTELIERGVKNIYKLAIAFRYRLPCQVFLASKLIEIK